MFQRIKPFQTKPMLCIEAAAGPCGLVVFGASGDLAHRKLFVSLFELWRADLMSRMFYCLGCGRTNFSDQAFREKVGQSLQQATDGSLEAIQAFLQHVYYLAGDYRDNDFYRRICQRSMELETFHQVEGVRIFYLSVPPFLYGDIIERIGQMRLMCPAATGRLQPVRIVIEKPFGSDLASARQLDHILKRYFQENQIYRIDHFLGKETVQNLLVFRFANSLFEPVWNRNYIDHIQITIAEKIGVEHRGDFYDKTGALRDMFQNHILQMLTLVAMEPPVAFDADSIRDEKTKLLRSLRPLTERDVARYVVRGQYSAGLIDGQPVVGYRDERGVAKDSATETFVAAKVFVDNWRWKDVPFYVRTGKRLKRKLTELVVQFKPIPYSMFRGNGLEMPPPNVLRFQIQPDEGIYLQLQAKHPGSKMCINTLEMALDYQEVFGVQMPEAYQRLLLDCMLGDPTLFDRQDSIELCWQYVMPILQFWQQRTGDVFEYPAGAAEIPPAEQLMVADGRRWNAL